MILPIGHQRAQQVGPSQEGRILVRWSSQNEMIASASAGMAAVQHELFCAQSRQPRFFIQTLGLVNHLVPRRRRVHVYLDNAGIGCDSKDVEAWVERRRVTLNHHWHVEK